MIINTVSEGSHSIPNLGDLPDVEISDLSDGQVLAYNATTQKWENAKTKLVLWSTGTDKEIADMIDAYYTGSITLEEIQSVWSVGDSRAISLSAMSATGVAESHRAQSVDVQILDFNHDILTTPINGKTKALITVDLKNCLRDATVSDTDGANNSENGYMNSTNTNVGGWTSCARRTWCNDIFYNALPSYLRTRVTPVNKLTSAGNQSSTINTDSDKCFLLSEIEVNNTNNITYAGEGSQYALFAISTLTYDTKLPNWNANSPGSICWSRSPYKSNAAWFVGHRAGIIASEQVAANPRGLAPAFCL